MLNDIHHLTFITADMDRLISFYERLFDAQVTVDLHLGSLLFSIVLPGEKCQSPE